MTKTITVLAALVAFALSGCAAVDDDSTDATKEYHRISTTKEW